jgi:hypothetical protein
MSGAVPGGNRSASTTSTCPAAQALDVVAGAGQGTRVQVGGHDARDAAAREHRRDHAGAGADVPGQRGAGGQRRLRDQVEVLAAHRREHAVVRVDAVGRRRPERRHLHALLAPFMRAHQPEHSRSATTQGWPSGGPQASAHARAGRAPGAADAVVAADFDHHHAEHPRAAPLRLPVR